MGSKNAPTLMLGYVHNGEVRHEFMRAVLETLNAADWKIILLDVQSGPLLSRARNSVAETLLETRADYLLSVDTDVAWHQEDVRKLLTLAKQQKDIVGGHYFGYSPTIGHISTAGRQREDGVMETLTQVPTSGHEKVDFVGMGFTLIKRKVIEALKPDKNTLWPFAEAVVDGQARGEDITFCMRAAELGFQSWACFDVELAHIKSVPIG